MSPYLKVVFPSPEDEGYIAEAPELEYCSAFGETAEEALSELDKVIELWLQSAQEAGRPMPQLSVSRHRLSTSTTTTETIIEPQTESHQPAQPVVAQELVPA